MSSSGYLGNAFYNYHPTGSELGMGVRLIFDAGLGPLGAIPVRLSDGSAFYSAIGGISSGSLPDSGTIQALLVQGSEVGITGVPEVSMSALPETWWADDAVMRVTGSIVANIPDGSHFSIVGTPTVHLDGPTQVTGSVSLSEPAVVIVSNVPTVQVSGTVNITSPVVIVQSGSQPVHNLGSVGVTGSVALASGTVVTLSSNVVSFSGIPSVAIASGTVTVNPNSVVNVSGSLGLLPGTTVGVSGSVSLAANSTVSLSPGASVSLTSGSLVSLAPGGSVSLSAGTTVGISGSVELRQGSGTVSTSNPLPISAGVSGDVIYQNGITRIPRYTFADVNLIGGSTIVAAQGAGVKIRVVSMFISAGAGLSVRMQSGSNSKGPLLSLAANGSLVLPFNPLGWFETNANEPLNAVTLLALAFGIQVVWIQTT